MQTGCGRPVMRRLKNRSPPIRTPQEAAQASLTCGASQLLRPPLVLREKTITKAGGKLSTGHKWSNRKEITKILDHSNHRTFLTNTWLIKQTHQP